MEVVLRRSPRSVRTWSESRRNPGKEIRHTARWSANLEGSVVLNKDNSTSIKKEETLKQNKN